MRSSRTWQTLSRTPGIRVIGGNAYRQSLGHVCTIASSPRGAGWVRENQSGQWDVSRDANRSTCAWPNSLHIHISSTTSGGASLPSASAPPMCCLSGRAHCGPWDLLGNSWEQEIQPTSPDGWCAMRDDGPSTDPDLSIPLRSHVSILRRHEAPNTDPETGTKVSSTLRKHRHVTLIMRKVLSHYCRGLMYNSPKGITLDAAAIRPNCLWNCLTVSDWPSLILFTADRMDSICAGWQTRLYRCWVPCLAKKSGPL